MEKKRRTHEGKKVSKLEAIKIALHLKITETDSTPQTQDLVEYFDDVITHTKGLLDKKIKIDSDVEPEAITLALKIKNQPELLEILNKIPKYKSLTPEIAKMALRIIE